MPIADSCLEIHLLCKVLPCPCKAADTSLSSWLEGDLTSGKRHVNHLLEGLDNLLATLLLFILKQTPGSPQQGEVSSSSGKAEVFTNGTVRAVTDKTDRKSTLLLLSSSSSLAAQGSSMRKGTRCYMSENPQTT